MSAIASDLLRSFDMLSSRETWRKLFAERIPYEDGIELLFRDGLLWAFNETSSQFVASIEYKVAALGQRHVDFLVFSRTPALVDESWDRFPPARALEVGLGFLEFKSAYARLGGYPCGGADGGRKLKKDIDEKLVSIWVKAQQQYPASAKECYAIAVLVGYYFNNEMRKAWRHPSIDPSVALDECRANLQRGLGTRPDKRPYDVSTYRRKILNGESMPSDPRVTMYAEALLIPVFP